MIGRVYDPVIGRFCSADPFVQAPGNSQSYNRYSYCINNPLSLTDPTGYSWLSQAGSWAIGGIVGHFIHPIAEAGRAAGKWVAQNWRTVTTIAATAVVSIVTAGVLTGPAIGMATGWAMTAAGAIGGAVNGGLSTALAGGSISQIWHNTIRGAIVGAATAGLTYGVAHGVNGGSIFGEGGFGSGAWVETKAVEAGIGGGASIAQGGDFKSGALGVVGGIVSGQILSTNNTMINTVLAAAAGGTVSKLCGGSFMNGAMVAAFTYLFNDIVFPKGYDSKPLYEYLWKSPSARRILEYFNNPARNVSVSFSGDLNANTYALGTIVWNPNAEMFFLEMRQIVRS